MIAIIDYDAGNIKSVEKSLNYLGEEAIITRDHDEIVNSDKVILPGVGAFADAMEKIRHYGLEETIHEVVEKNIPFLGICLGLQLMFESSDEGPGVKGLGLLPGKILRIPKSGDLKIPHMGWNNIKVKEDSRLFKGLPENPYVYFVHSYYGESNIDRLSRWDIKDEIFSFMGILYPQLPKTPTGVRFLDDIGNEYTAIVFKTEQALDYILINTDVNDEIYQGWNGTTSLNLFPVMDFERYRTRIIEKGQMELINLTKAEFKIKRKADFI